MNYRQTRSLQRFTLSSSPLLYLFVRPRTPPGTGSGPHFSLLFPFFLFPLVPCFLIINPPFLNIVDIAQIPLGLSGREEPVRIWFAGR
jgi:hypothetical protein